MKAELTALILFVLLSLGFTHTTKLNTNNWVCRAEQSYPGKYEQCGSVGYGDTKQQAKKVALKYCIKTCERPCEIIRCKAL